MATITEALTIAIDHHIAGRFAEAETLYGRILDAAPRHAHALHLSGVLAAQIGRLEAARDRLVRAVRESADNAAYRLDLGKALVAAGDWPAAETVLSRTLTLVPDLAEGWDLLAVALYHRRADSASDLDAPIAALAHARALAPERVETTGRLALLHQWRGREHLKRHRHALALADLRAAVAGRPDDTETRFLLATALFDSQRFTVAVEGYRHTLALDPESTAAHHNLGLALAKAGQGVEAVEIFRRATRLDPDHIGARDALVLALETRDPEEALAWSRAVLALKLRLAESGAGPAPLPPALPAGATARTRNIVSFSLWGSREVYGQGAIANARMMPALLPGWVCRFYHDDSVPRPVLAELAALGAELVERPAGSGPAQGLYWRFLVSDDPTVARFLCRDCDSRPTAREVAAVEAWVASGRSFHVMRDHVLHTDLVLAGMWGGMAGLLPPLAPVIDVVASGDADRWQDQRFLAEWLWPRIRDRVLVHDSVHPDAGEPFPPAPDDPVSPHIGAKVLQLRTAPDGAAPADTDLPPEVRRPPAGPGEPALGEREGRHGLMRFFLADAYVGRSLALYGEWSEDEHRLAAALLAPGDVVVEAGANLGAHTVPLARAVGPAGLVHAFEPQHALFDLLVHNLAANGLDNAVPHLAAVGDMTGLVTVPVADYRRPGNFGAVRMGALDGKPVPVETVDGLGLERLALLKADVEGMESLVLDGAARTIARHRPALYLENDREEGSAELIARIQGFGYRLWWHIVPLYDPANAAGNLVNAFPGVVSINLLALPPDRPCPRPGLPEVTSPDQSWREAAWNV